MTQQLSFWNRFASPVEPPISTVVYDKAPRRLLTIKELPETERPVNRLHH